jgi:serine/threonine protein phosphatase 1
MMRYLAIGDIHGCFKALTTLAEFVPFYPHDVVITLGDYVDRGPDSCAVLDWLVARKQSGNLVPLRGNHEVMMLEAQTSREGLQRWMDCGAAATLASYSAGDKLADVPESHWKFLEETRRCHELDSHFFVHANAYAECSLEEQPDDMLFWESFHIPPPHQSGKIMVCGHTPQKTGKPLSIGHAVCIDTWAYGDGWLTCLDVEAGEYWQANERGETRWSWLEEEIGWRRRW